MIRHLLLNAGVMIFAFSCILIAQENGGEHKRAETKKLLSLINNAEDKNKELEKIRSQLLSKEGYKQDDIKEILASERQARKKKHPQNSVESMVRHFFKDYKIGVSTKTIETVSFALKQVIDTPRDKQALAYHNVIAQEAYRSIESNDRFKGVSKENLLYTANKWPLWFYENDIETLNTIVANAGAERAKLKQLKIKRAEQEKQNEKLVSLVAETLAKKNITETHSAYKTIFSNEFDIQMKLLDVTEAEKPQKSLELHKQTVEEFLITNQLFDSDNKELLEKILEFWEKIFYSDNDIRLETIENAKKLFIEEQFKQVKKDWEEFILSKNLPKAARTKLSSMELVIRKKILHLPVKEKKQAFHSLHVTQAKKIIVNDNMGVLNFIKNKDLHKFTIEYMSEHWEEWLFLNSPNKLLKFQHLRDMAELIFFINTPLLNILRTKEHATLHMKLINDIEKIETRLITAIKKQQNEDAKLLTSHLKKMGSVFDREIKLFERKKENETVIQLKKSRDSFFQYGLCPPTENEKIEHVKQRANEDKIKIYNKLYEEHKKSIRQIKNHLISYSKRNTVPTEIINIVIEKFEKFEKNYTEFGSRFPHAKIYIINSAPNIINNIEVHVDDKIIPSNSFNRSQDLVVTDKGTPSHFKVMSAQIPLRMGQSIFVKTKVSEDYYSEGKKKKPNVICHITLIPDHCFVLSNKKTWESFQTNSETDWKNAKKMNNKTPITEESNTYSTLTHKDGTSSQSHGILVAPKTRGISFFRTIIDPKLFTTTHIPIE